MASAIIATGITVDYHPAPVDIPHAVSFIFTEQDGNQTTFVVPCVGTGPDDVRDNFGLLMRSLNQLFVRNLDG
jgi:hypothetical protein